MASKAPCDFVFPKGRNKGQPCGTNCIVVEGQQNRCALHKEVRLARKSQLVTEHTKGTYITKDMRLASLEQSFASTDEKCKQQEIQIALLSEELAGNREQVVSLKRENNEMRSTLAEQQKRIDVLEKDLTHLHKENEQIREQLAESVAKGLDQDKAFAEQTKTIANLETKLKAVAWQCAQINDRNENQCGIIMDYKEKLNEAFSKLKYFDLRSDALVAKMKDFEKECIKIIEDIKKK